MALARTLLILLSVVAIVAVLAACGEKDEAEEPRTEGFELTLDFYPNPDHVGIYSAEEQGYFRDAGLDVSINTPTDPATPIKEVAAGRTDLAISYEPEVAIAREQGLDVVAVAAIVDQPLTSLIWLRKSGIRDVADLAGERVATAGIPYQEGYLETILAAEGVSIDDVEVVNVGQGLLPAILGGQVDAMLGGFSNVEGVDLRLRGEHPTVLAVDELGVPEYDELVLVAQGERLEEDPEPIRLFIGALARGTAAAVGDPDAATATLLEANDALDPRLTAAEVAATVPLLSTGGEGERPFGYMDPAEWREFIGWMRDNGLVSALPDPAELLTNEYLPGEIPE